MTLRWKDALEETQALALEDSPWHAALLASLRDVTATQARWRPNAEANSIWSIVRHATHWKNGLMRAWDGDGFDYDAWHAADWDALPADDAAWPEDVAALERAARLLRSRLAAADVKLLEIELEGFGGPARRHLLNAATHDAYHAGQVRLLLRLQGLP